MHDKRHADATGHGRALVKAVGRVGHLRPAAGVGGVGRVVADGVGLYQAAHQRSVFGEALAAVLQVHHAGRAANRVGAVVRGDHDQRVVQLAALFQEGQQTPHVLVNVVHQPGVARHVACVEFFLICRQGRPLRDAGVARRQHGVGLYESHGALALKPRQAQGVPPGLIHTLVLGLVFGLGVVWRVRRLEGEVGEERFVWRAGAVFGDPGDSAAGVVVGGKVAFWISVHLRELVAFEHAVGLVVAGFCAHEAVEAVKAALHGPAAVVGGAVKVAVVGVVPLAQSHGGPALFAQQLGDQRRVLGYLAPVARVARVVVREPAAAHAVRIFARQQGCTGWRAHGHRGVVGVAKTVCRQAVDVRRLNFATVTTEVGEAQVVKQDHDDVGTALRRTQTGRPARRGLRERAAHVPRKIGARVGDFQ